MNSQRLSPGIALTEPRLGAPAEGSQHQAGKILLPNAGWVLR